MVKTPRLKTSTQHQPENEDGFMRYQSRRDFISSCLYLATSGIGCALLCGPLGCKGKRESASLSSNAGSGDTQGTGPNASEVMNAEAGTILEPRYVELHRTGELKRRGDELWSIMESCSLCPRECGANRLEGEEGFCGSSSQLEIASYHPHFGEERSLVGEGGSGTVFFTNCSLRCVFCINWEISQGGQGEARSIDELAAMMIHLQKIGCPNINVVTPTHYPAHIVLALDIAAGNGLKVPLVYNTCGWERLEILKRLDGVVDIYLPDFKYADGEMADRYSSGADTYPEVTKAALLEMHRQVGVAHPAEDGLMYRGLMIRHLVMPNGVGGTKQVIEWIADNLPKDTYLNIMSQYRPMHKAFEYPKISRRLHRKEYEEAVTWAKEAGLTNLDIQGWRSG